MDGAGELRRDAALAIARRVALLVRNLDEPMSMREVIVLERAANTRSSSSGVASGSCD